jgi:carbon storage regulator
MLCFTRRAGQKLRIGGDIVMSVQRVRGGSVRLGFDVPADVIVDREEIAESKKRERVVSNLKYVAERKPAKTAVKAPVKRKSPKAPPRAAKKSRNNSP